ERLAEPSTTMDWPSVAATWNPNRFERKPKFPSLRRISGREWLCTNQLEPFRNPPVMNARARIMELAGSERPLSCQPPEMRVPGPRSAQVAPSVLVSKLVRQASGAVPPRSQVIVE